MRDRSWRKHQRGRMVHKREKIVLNEWEGHSGCN
jgi:hypothetical protein